MTRSSGEPQEANSNINFHLPHKSTPTSQGDSHMENDIDQANSAVIQVPSSTRNNISNPQRESSRNAESRGNTSWLDSVPGLVGIIAQLPGGPIGSPLPTARTQVLTPVLRLRENKRRVHPDSDVDDLYATGNKTDAFGLGVVLALADRYMPSNQTTYRHAANGYHLENSHAIDSLDRQMSPKRLRRSEDSADNVLALLPALNSRSSGVAESEQRGVAANGPKWLKLLPPEVYALFADHLPLDSLKSLRLVSRDFEHNISGLIFKHVVVPFTSHVYGNFIQEDEPAILKGRRLLTPSQETAKGEGYSMETFKGFGHHILKFGMSFEFDETLLVDPPPKEGVEVIKAFWGTYKWPVSDYNRYEACAGLETIANRTNAMRAAFSQLVCVQELALSVDNGLGWLSGADLPPRKAIFRSKPRVFGPSNPLPDAKSRHQTRIWEMLLEAIDTPWRRSKLRQSLARVALLPSRQEVFWHNLWDAVSEPLTEQPPSGPDSISDIHEGSVISDDLYIAELSDRCYWSKPGERFVVGASLEEIFRNSPLRPHELRSAQKEWLLETGWAQQAFLQSYCVAVIDNELALEHVCSLNLARLPCSYVACLGRKDFWASLKYLERITLNVIPEWRKLERNKVGIVESYDILPSASIETVYIFLRDFIGKMKSVKALCFSWAGGGEQAPGLCARNQHVLAAPLVKSADAMLNNDFAQCPKLVLPYVKNLTLSNCWASPAVLTLFAKTMAQHSLQNLRFDSFSLSAGPAEGYMLPDEPIQLHPERVMQLPGPYGPHPAGTTNINGSEIPNPLPYIPGFMCTLDTEWLGPPRPGSWVDVIEMLSPGRTLAELRANAGLGEALEKQDLGGLLRLEFDSCGYVHVAGNFFDQRVIDIPSSPVRDLLKDRKAALESHIMRTSDLHLGAIIPHLYPHDTEKLVRAWNMQFGWTNASAALETEEDGLPLGGMGRFRGTIERVEASSGEFSSIATLGGVIGD